MPLSGVPNPRVLPWFEGIIACDPCNGIGAKPNGIHKGTGQILRSAMLGRSGMHYDI